MQRVVWALLLSGSAATNAARFGQVEQAENAAGRATGGAPAPPGRADADDRDFAVLLALKHFLEKRQPPGSWEGQSFMVRYMELSPGRSPRVCGEPPLGGWGGLDKLSTPTEQACNDACLADPKCSYAAFQVETGECTGFSKCSTETSVVNRPGTYIVNERTLYACSLSPSWCGACKHAGMSAAAADSCHPVDGEWFCAGFATCVAAGESEAGGHCAPGRFVCAGRGSRDGQLGSASDQAAAVIAALDERGMHPACPRLARNRHPLKPVGQAAVQSLAQLPAGSDDSAVNGSGLLQQQDESSTSTDQMQQDLASLRHEVERLRQSLNATDGNATDQVPEASDGGEGHWVLVFRQTKGDYNWLSWTKNAEDPSAENYAILDQLDRFRGSDGKFKFKLRWAGGTAEGEGPQIWKQASNPTSATAVLGYEPVDVKCTGNNWFGLALSKDGTEAMIDGSEGFPMYYAIGSKYEVGAGIPACQGAASKTELYVWEEGPGGGQNATRTVATTQRTCTEEEKAAMSHKWLQGGSRLDQMCSVYTPPVEYEAMGDMPPPALWIPEEGTPECCDAGQSCEVAGFRILENYLTLYSLCVPITNRTAR